MTALIENEQATPHVRLQDRKMSLCSGSRILLSEDRWRQAEKVLVLNSERGAGPSRIFHRSRHGGTWMQRCPEAVTSDEVGDGADGLKCQLCAGVRR